MIPPRGTRVAASAVLLLGASLVGLLPAPAAADEPVTWTNAVNVSVNGNSLTKTGTATAWDAGAASLQVIRDGYGYVDFTATETNKHRIVSLANGDSNQSDSDVDFGIILLSNGWFGTQQGASFSGQISTYATGDRFRVEIWHGVVRYKKNGTVFLTSANRPKFPLRVDSALREPGATISNVRIGNTVWANEVGVSTTGSSLTKTGATGWTSGAASANSVEAADGFLEFVATETNTTRIAGLGTNDTGQTAADVEFGIQLRDDAVVEIVESGTSRGTFGSYSAGDRFRVEVRNGAIEYVRAPATLLYSSTVTATYPLRVDTALYSAGATLTDVVLEPLIWENETGVSVSGNGLTKTAADGWNAAASSSRQIASGDAFVEFTAIETDTRRTVGLKSGTGAASSFAEIDYAIDLSATGVIEVFELGTSRGQFGSYAHGDRLRVEIHEGSTRYLRNGQVLYTSSTAPTYPLHGEATLYTSAATVADVHMGDVVWTNSVGLDTSATTIRKSGTTTAWDAGLVSTRAINSGYVEIVASETNTHRAIGLSHGNRSAIDTDIDYALLMAPYGTLYIFESGTLRHSTTYTTGDRLRVGIDGSTIKYYRNGTMIYPSTVAPTFSLRVDSSFHNTNATILGVVLVGAAVTDTLEPPTFAPPAGTYTAEQNVTLTSFPGATIRFTTDGTEPTETSTAYTAPVAVNQSLTLKAKAWKAGFDPSTVASAVYTLKVANPGVSPGGGSYNTEQTVTITCSVSGADIHYTTTGVDPTQADPVVASGGTVIVSSSSTLKVRAWKAGWTPSSVVANTYTLAVGQPTLSPGGGSFVGALPVTVSTATPGATLRYRTDGGDPTESDPVVASGSAVTIDRSTTLKVKGFRAGWTTSNTTAATYWINLGTAVTPTFSPLPGTFGSAQTVGISTATSGAVIRYTLDGSEPTVRSALYATPISVDSTTDLQARAFGADMTPSASAGGLYVIDTGAVDTPRLSPGGGTYPTSQVVTVTSQTPGATIRYRLDGIDPDESDPVLPAGQPLTLGQYTRLTARAFKAGMNPSGVRRADYILTGSVSVGANHTLAVRSDGTAWSWGRNDYGSLGDPSLASGAIRTVPGQVGGISDAIAVAGGTSHSLALGRDGTVLGWGRNFAGEVGDGTTTQRNSPVQVSGLTNVVAIAAGTSYSLALKADGSVWRWGSDGVGNYGSVPVQVSGLHGVSAIAAGSNFGFAVQSDGLASTTLWSWGNNAQGQLGDGTANGTSTPVEAAQDVTSVAGGNFHAYAVKTDGSVLAWGLNNYYQMGDGTTNQRYRPAAIPGLTGVVAVTAGDKFGAAVKTDGTVWAFGYNGYGQLGDETGTNRSTPVQSHVITGATHAAANGGGSHMAAIKSDATLWTWGRNDIGALGDGTIDTNSKPKPVPSLVLASVALVSSDRDGDGLSDAEELTLGTDRLSVDTNGDGIPDANALAAGLSATNTDMDGDGILNAVELSRGTDPFRADTDGDGTPDSTDAFPLDPTRTAMPAGDPSDVTPPVITLTHPTNAVLVSSQP